MYSPKPSTSGLQSMTRDNDSDSLECDSAEEDDKCCVCGKFYPPSEIESLKIVGWAQCEKCDHWVHLAFCTKERDVRKTCFRSKK